MGAPTGSVFISFVAAMRHLLPMRFTVNWQDAFPSIRFSWMCKAAFTPGPSLLT
jgi:hypothetical protein